MSKKEEIVIEKANAELSVKDSFATFIEQLKGFESKAMAVVVTHASEIDKMEEAGQMAKTLQKIRTSSEKLRKELKAPYLSAGKEIDAIYKKIESTVKPLEKHLKQQHKYVEYQEELRVSELQEKRFTHLYDMGLDEHINPNVLSTVGSLRNDEYKSLKDSTIALKKAREKEEKRELIRNVLAQSIMSKSFLEVNELIDRHDWKKKDIKAMSDGDVEPITLMLSKDELLAFLKLRV